MKDKADLILKNLEVALSSDCNDEATKFLIETEVFVAIIRGDDGTASIPFINKEGIGEFIPVYLNEENKSRLKTEAFPLLSVLVHLSNNNVKGFILIDNEENNICQVSLSEGPLYLKDVSKM